MLLLNTFKLQIATPDGEFFNGDAERIIARAIDGDVCILAKHSKYVTAITAGIVRVRMDDESVRRAACSGGMLSCMGDVVRLVATTFEWEEDIDPSRAQRAKHEAEKAIENARTPEEVEHAKQRLSRAVVRSYLGKDD